jgi:putative transcriptional regulator
VSSKKTARATKSGVRSNVGPAGGRGVSSKTNLGRVAGDHGLTDVDKEIIEALAEFRDTLRDGIALETKYTVRRIAAVSPPPSLGPEQIRRTREMMGVSQQVFADFLGASASTIRSWEQGQKVPSPMARRFLGLIESDPAYWKSRFFAMVAAIGSEQ